MSTKAENITDGLVDRISTVVLKTYEVQQMLQTVSASSFVRTGFHVNRAENVGLENILFECVLTLEAERSSGDPLPNSYQVGVWGELCFESPAWELLQILEVRAPAQQNLW